MDNDEHMASAMHSLSYNAYEQESCKNRLAAVDAELAVCLLFFPSLQLLV